MATIKIKFKDTITMPSSATTFNITFTTPENSDEYNKMIVNYNNEGGINYYYNSSVTAVYNSSGWRSYVYKTIEIDTTQANFQTFINAMKDNIEGVELEAGTYQWIGTPENPNACNTNLNFTSNNENFTGIKVYEGAVYLLAYINNGTSIDVFNYDDWDWKQGTAYRTITTTSNQYVDYDFYNYAILGNQLVKQATEITYTCKWYLDGTLVNTSTFTHEQLTGIDYNVLGSVFKVMLSAETLAQYDYGVNLNGETSNASLGSDNIITIEAFKSNIVFNITSNGTTTLATKNTYVPCDIDFNVNVPTGSSLLDNTVTFKVGNEVYQIVSVNAGTYIEAPEPPAITDGNFNGWKKSDGTLVSFPYTPTEDITLTADVIVQTNWVFGVSGINSSSPQLTRTDDAVGKTWSKDSNGLITTGFEEEFNFQRVVDSKGNVFIRIPKMYRYFEGGDVLKIANYKVNDKYVLYPMFIKNDGTECDYVDVGAYKGHVTNDTSVAQLLESKSGVIPTYSKTRAQFREYAANNTDSGYVYYQRDIRNMTWVQDMIQIVFATRQTTDFQGTTWKSYGKATGDTDSIVNNSLTNPLSVCGLKSGTYGFKFFGIEDLCGNGYEFIDGITFIDASVFYTYNTTKFSDSYNSDGMTYVGYGRSESSNYISKLGYNADHPCINIPTNTSGSISTYYCDFDNYKSSGVVLYTGAFNFHDHCGFWYFYGGSTATYTSSDLGSRLCRQPL